MKLKVSLTLIFIFVTLIFSCFTFYIFSLLKDLPSAEELKNYSPVLSTKILDRNEQLITELFTEKRTWTPYKDFPSHLKLAVLAIEDHKFYHHWGINPKRIVKAAIDNLIRAKIKVGGSTITQQLAKIAFLSHKRTIERKLKELLLALQLEQNFSKNEILEMYLNQVYLGHGAYGVAQAARIYFSKNVSELTLAESALIAGLIRSPSHYSPIRHLDRAIARKNVVLKRMLLLNYISKEEYKNAVVEIPVINQTPVSSFIAPYFVEYVKEQLEKKYPSEMLYSAGLIVKTTLDLKFQKYAEEIFEGQLSALDKISKSSEPVQGAFVVLDVKTGEILAMIGGRDFKKSQFNRVTQALRQPGSAFKPIVYLSALENGFTPVSIIEDTPLLFYNDGIDWRLLSTTTDYTTLDFKKFGVKDYNEFIKEMDRLKEKNKLWIPENYRKKYHGKVTLRRALEFSLNSCSIRLIMEIGPSTVIKYARELGITTPLTNTFSLALGASEVIPLELVSAYSVFANRGIKTQPYAIIEVRDRFGNVIEKNQPQEKIVLSPESAYLITSLLKGVVERGTGIYASNLGKICAGKTGTTNDCADTWFIGYTPDIICGVWVGYDQRKTLGRDATGGRIACPIWTEFMKLATKDIPNKDFEKPDNIIEVPIDKSTGLLAGPETKPKDVYIETFLRGTEPKIFSYATVISSSTLSEPSSLEQETGF